MRKQTNIVPHRRTFTILYWIAFAAIMLGVLYYACSGPTDEQIHDTRNGGYAR